MPELKCPVTEKTTISESDVKALWEENAENWIKLNEHGFNVFRDKLSDPGFFSMLPPVAGLTCLDIGCGEGAGARQLADRGAAVTGVDISAKMIRQAKKIEADKQQNIAYLECSATSLPFSDGSFDCIASFCALMDVGDLDKVLSECYRTLKYNGFIQFSITHPCFWDHKCYWVQDENKNPVAIEIRNYFDSHQGKINEWTFDGVKEGASGKLPNFRTPIFKRTLSHWITAINSAGFYVEAIAEPRPSEETVLKYPEMNKSRIVPFFLILRCRKL